MAFDPTDLLILFAFGCAGGVLAGLLGIGGGIVYVVVFTYYLQKYHLGDIEVVRFIVSNSIFAVFFAGVAASWKQIRKNNFFLREVIYTALPGVLSALIVSYLIIQYNWYSKERFTLFFIIMLGLLAYRMFLPDTRGGKSLIREGLPLFYYALVGFISGAVSSLSGLGGGVIVIPVLAGMLRLNILKASSISLGIMPFYTLAMSVFYALAHGSPQVDIPYTYGYIILPLSVPMALGVIVAAPVGVKIAHKLPHRWIKLFFALIMIVVIIKMIYGLYYS